MKWGIKHEERVAVAATPFSPAGTFQARTLAMHVSPRFIPSLSFRLLAGGMLLASLFCEPMAFGAPPAPSPSGIESSPSPAATGTGGNSNGGAQAISSGDAIKASLMLKWLQTPITFYGKVVDEKGNPVAGAKVILTPAASMDPNAVPPDYQRTSDTNGLFSIRGVHGIGLTVIVSKEGYYSLPGSGGNFGYAAGAGFGKPHPDQNDPAIFVLRKMGGTEPLIVLKRNVKVSRTGIPITMDLRTGKAFGDHSLDFRVEAWTNDQGIVPGTLTRYDWKCIISVPGGGLQSRTGEFNFQAPADGYKPSDEIVISAKDPKWDSEVTREYFLKLANGEYARIKFTMCAGGDNFFSVTSYLNPTPGHRNLEYDPDQKPEK